MNQPRATPREWTGLAVLALPTLLIALDLSVLFLALPHLGADLQATNTQTLWIMDIYGFMIAGFLITMGTLGDRIGRRKLLMIGAAAFGAASLLAAYSSSAEMLIATRALLGIAGATLMPSTLALIRNMFHDPKQRTVAIAVWLSSFTAGIAIGPVVGGMLLEVFWWGSVFLLGVPLMVLLMVTAPLLLPEYRDTEAGRLDLISVTLSLAAILPIIYGVKELAKDGLAGSPILAMVTGGVFGLVFVARQRRVPDPLLDLRLFTDRAFNVALGVILLATATVSGIDLLVVQYLQLVEGLSPLRAGLWLVPSAVGAVIGAMLAPSLTRWMRPGSVIGAGLGLSALGFLLLTQVDTSPGLGLLVTGLVIAFVGISPIGVLGTDLVLGLTPPEKAGSAASMSETSAELGTALGVATLGSVANAVFRDRISGAIPVGVPSEVAETAGDSLVGAGSVAEQLPFGLAAGLLQPAREAFTAGLNLASGIGAAAAITGALLAVILLRRVRPRGGTVPVEEDAAVGIDTAIAGAEATR